MRAAITVTEGLFDPTPADKAIAAVDGALDPEWGDLVVDTLETKSSHPYRHKWPIDGDDIVILDHIEASEPGQGYGGMMMEVLVGACDAHGCRIYLDAHAFGDGMDQRSLVTFYREWGFVDCPEMKGFANHAMMRLPTRS